MNKTRRTDSLHICKLSYTTRFLYSTFYARVLELTALLIGGGARAAWLKERSACFWFRAFRSGLSAAVRFLFCAAISMIFRTRSLCFGWHQSHYCLLWDSCQNIRESVCTPSESAERGWWGRERTMSCWCWYELSFINRTRSQILLCFKTFCVDYTRTIREYTAGLNPWGCHAFSGASSRASRHKPFRCVKNLWRMVLRLKKTPHPFTMHFIIRFSMGY